MKLRTGNLFLIIPVIIALFLVLPALGHGFHSGGVADCDGCHSMHNPHPNAPYLLLGTDQSSTCLNCHEQPGDAGPESYHVSTPAADMPQGAAPRQRTPGGDFGWLKKTYNFNAGGSAVSESGSLHGHNIIAADFGYSVDPAHSTAPGGVFPSAQLACHSCHDPHGRYRRLSTGAIATAGAPIIASGSYNDSPVPASGQAVGVYRLLAGAGYAKGGVTYAGVPVAVAPSSYNRTEAVTQTRVAYGHSLTGGHTSWGRWCATCHPDMHTDTSPVFVHPVDRNLPGLVSSKYNIYVGSGKLTGIASKAYLTLVPFAETTANYATLATHAKTDDSYLQGAAGGSRVNCLTCHRAHASGWTHALRWKMEGEFIVYNGTWPGTDTTPDFPQLASGRTSAETQAAYYDRPATVFAAYQRSLCNKCHVKD